MAKVEIKDDITYLTIYRSDFERIGEGRHYSGAMHQCAGFAVIDKRRFKQYQQLTDQKFTTEFVIVIYDEMRETYGDKVLDIILTHEVGHIKLGHLHLSDEEAIANKSKIELEADDYAAKIHGKKAVHRALMKTVKVLAPIFAKYEKTTIKAMLEELKTDSIFARRLEALA